MYSNAPFTVSTDALPANYSGNNPKDVYDQLDKLSSAEKKTEFENTQDYKRRLDVQHAKPILGDLRFDSVLAFQVEPKGDRNFIAIYDADKGVLRLSVPTESVASGESITLRTGVEDLSSGPGETLLNAKKEILYSRSKDYVLLVHNRERKPIAATVRLTAKAAEDVKGNVRAIGIGRLHAPYASQATVERKPTFDIPLATSKQIDYLHVRLLEVWFYDLRTGAVLAKVRSTSTSE